MVRTRGPKSLVGEAAVLFSRCDYGASGGCSEVQGWKHCLCGKLRLLRSCGAKLIWPLILYLEDSAAAEAIAALSGTAGLYRLEPVGAGQRVMGRHPFCNFICSQKPLASRLGFFVVLRRDSGPGPRILPERSAASG